MRSFVIKLDIRTRLLALAAVAVICAFVLAGFGVLAGRWNGQALGSVYHDGVRTLVQLQKIDTSLREVRFRVAGVLLDSMPVQGSLNHLRESRREIGRLWEELKPTLADLDAGEHAALRDELVAGWAQVDALLGKVDQAYTTKDKAQLQTVLDDDWAVLHKRVIKPLQALIPLREAAAKATFERSATTNDRLNVGALALAVAMTLLLGAAAWWTT
ncbi:MAG: MCP four helix bundle domain-containing protein, partial [Burkholderiaceae bacterium]|nr:MCP four helix bundle domain-containing protein [Burkholderiaceae bacterium]